MSKARIGVIAISVGEDAGGQVAIAAVADDGDDDRVFQLSRNAQRHVHRAARGDAGEDALFARQAARHFLGIRLADILEAVDALAIVDLRQISLGPLADAGDLRAFLGLAADDLDRLVLLLEKARAAHDGAGRAHARD